MKSNIKYASKSLLPYLEKLNSFTVQSVFKNVINVCNGDRIISIQNSCIPKTPMALTTEDTNDYRTLTLRISERVHYNGNSIFIGNNVFNLSSQEIWNAGLRAFNNSYEYNTVKILEVLSKVIKGFGILDGLGKAGLYYYDCTDWSNNLDELSLKGLFILCNTNLSLKKQDLERAADEITDLIGMGPGLTPSGDDFLVGLLSVLYIWKDMNSTALQLLNSLKNKVLKKIDGTNLISREFIRHAALGEFSENFHDIYRSIERENYDEVYINAIKFLKVGHSSGTDGLLGILYGFNLIKNKSI